MSQEREPVEGVVTALLPDVGCALLSLAPGESVRVEIPAAERQRVRPGVRVEAVLDEDGGVSEWSVRG